MNREGELLTADELAQKLRLRPRTIQTWARTGRIPFVKPTLKVVRFDWEAVLVALKQDNRARRSDG